MKPNNGRRFDMALWICQWIAAVAFHFIALVKLGATADLVRHYFGNVGTTERLHTVALVEAGISLAVILPAVTRILPRLSIVAAGCLSAAALLGSIVPMSAAGAGIPVLNVALAAIAAFVVLGRIALAPITPFPDEEKEPLVRQGVRSLALRAAEARDTGGRTPLPVPDEEAARIVNARQRAIPARPAGGENQCAID